MKKTFATDKERIDTAWAKIEPMLEEVNLSIKKPINWFKVGISAVAATVLLSLSISFLYKNHVNKEVTYVTEYGQTLKILLPDSSTVTLNGNSKLSYINNWNSKESRSVNLKGEAYFSVKHTKSNQKFFVKMANNLSIEVLGTEFNVSQRDKNARVVLNSGKIKFHMENLNNSGKNNIIMKPGDLIEYEGKKHTYTQKVVNPNIYSSWKSSLLVFDKTKLSEVLNTLKNTYGVKVEMLNPKMMDMTVSGSAPNNNINELIEGLSETFNIKIEKKGDTIIVSK